MALTLTDRTVLKLMKRARALTHFASAHSVSWQGWSSDERWFAENIARLMLADTSRRQRACFRAVLGIYNEMKTFDEPLPDNVIDRALIKDLPRSLEVRNPIFTDEGHPASPTVTPTERKEK